MVFRYDPFGSLLVIARTNVYKFATQASEAQTCVMKEDQEDQAYVKHIVVLG